MDQTNVLNQECGCFDDKWLDRKKFFQEIGAEVVGNQLTIRMEKERKKLKKNRSQWDPACYCDTKLEEKQKKQQLKKSYGPKVLSIGEDNNQILFRINSESHFEYDNSVYNAEIVSELESDVNKQKIIIRPELDGPENHQEITENHLTVGGENVLLMKIKKDPEVKDQRRRNIELEVRYPKVKEKLLELVSEPLPDDLPTTPDHPEEVKEQNVTEEVSNENEGKDTVDVRLSKKPKGNKKNTKKKK